MPSVFENGGFIGIPKDFGDISRYIISQIAEFPVVESIATSNTGSGTSHSLTLPTGIQADDLLISIVTNDGGGDNVSFPSGWDQIAIINSPNSRSMGITIFKRIANGSESGTITITTPSTEATAHITYRISGATGEVSLSDWAQQASSNSSNQPQHTAPWGQKKNLWITSLGVETPQNATGYPVNYTNGTQSVINLGSSGGAGTYSAHRLLETATENPGSITFDTSWTGGAAITMVVEPVIVEILGNQKNSGIWNLDAVLDYKSIPITPVTFANLSGSKGDVSGDITLPALNSNQMIVFMERGNSEFPPATRSGFTSILTNSNADAKRSMNVQYRIGGSSETISTATAANYAVFNNATEIGATAVFSNSSSTNPLPIPAISGLNTSGNSLVYATAYFTTPITSVGSPYTVINSVGAYIEENTSSSLLQNSFTISQSVFHISVAIELKP
jgi:hypothetical protein